MFSCWQKFRVKDKRGRGGRQPTRCTAAPSLNPRYKHNLLLPLLAPIRRLFALSTLKAGSHSRVSLLCLSPAAAAFVFQRKKSAVSYLNSPLHQGTRKRGLYETLRSWLPIELDKLDTRDNFVPKGKSCGRTKPIGRIRDSSPFFCPLPTASSRLQPSFSSARFTRLCQSAVQGISSDATSCLLLIGQGSGQANKHYPQLKTRSLYVL